MLVETLLWFVHSRVRIAAVVLSRWILAVTHRMIVVTAVLTRRCEMRIRCVIVNSPIATVRQRIVTVRWLSFDEIMLWHHIGRITGRRRHLHLPQWVLWVYAAAVIWIRVAVVHIAQVHPYKWANLKKEKNNTFSWVFICRCSNIVCKYSEKTIWYNKLIVDENARERSISTCKTVA